MSRCLVVCVLAAAWLVSACTPSNDRAGSPAVTPSSTPAPIAPALEAVKRIASQDAAKDSLSDMKLVIESPDGKRETIDFRLRRRYESEGASTLLEVTSPKEESDKALLALEKAQGATEAISYLAGLKKVARLTSGSTLTLRGTRITIQELLWLELGQYTVAAGESVNENGTALLKYPLTAPRERNLAFPRIVAYFRANDMSPSRFELFDEVDKLQKTVVIEETKTIEGHECLTRVAIDDHAQNRKLLLSTAATKFNTGLQPRLFTESNLISIVNGASARILEGN
jgi:hypothetical protein